MRGADEESRCSMGNQKGQADGGSSNADVRECAEPNPRAVQDGIANHSEGPVGAARLSEGNEGGEASDS